MLSDSGGIRRVTVVEGVYHMGVDVPTTVTENRFSRDVESDEQPYIRRFTVGSDWVQLDTGWVDAIGMLVISNEEGRVFQRIPTKEEREETMRRVVEVAGTPPWLILPTESMRGLPANRSVRMRCLHGEARVVVTVVPK
jgi:hypothetical protein